MPILTSSAQKVVSRIIADLLHYIEQQGGSTEDVLRVAQLQYSTESLAAQKVAEMHEELGWNHLETAAARVIAGC